MDNGQSKLLMSELKRSIKAQGFTYQDVSEVLKMSESGFKKLINSQDCSLSKIEKICSVVGIRISDLFSSIEKLKLKDVSFTIKQEHFFITQPRGFLLFWLLVYERRNLDESQKLLNLDSKSMWSLLRKMDHLNLLKVLSGDRLSLPRPQGIKWVGRTRFVNDLYMRWGYMLLNHAINNKENDGENSYFNIRYLKMSESTWKEFKLKLLDLELQYSNTATREMRMNVQDLRHVRWLTIADQKSWVEDVISG